MPLRMPRWDPGAVGHLGLLRTEPWQMSHAERAWMVLTLSQFRPRHAVEVGAGGSTVVLSRFCRRVVSIDPFPPPIVEGLRRVEILEARSEDVLADALTPSVDFVLIDGDHTPAAVRADVETVLSARPRSVRMVVMHDTANDPCRAGIEAADWDGCSWVQHRDLAAVPSADDWGGIGVAVLHRWDLESRLSRFRRG